MGLRFDPRLKERFPELKVVVGYVRGVRVRRTNVALEDFKRKVIAEVRKDHDIHALKDIPIFRMYRDFFWRTGVDPTKVRPAAEALIRRILRGKSIPDINNVVDAYNMASIKTKVALAAFDLDKLRGELTMRFAKAGEEFLGIGMEKARELKGGEIVISDDEKLIAMYPHRDAEESKVTEDTRNILLLACGVPGITEKTLLSAAKTSIDYLTRFCEGMGKLNLSSE